MGLNEGTKVLIIGGEMLFCSFFLLPLVKWVSREVPKRNCKLVVELTNKMEVNIHKYGTVRLTMEITSTQRN